MDWLDRLARDSLGIVTRGELRQWATDDVIDGMVADKLLWPEFRGVYRTAGSPRTWEQRVLAACKAAGGDSFPSHGAGARLRGMRYVPASRIELTSPRRIRLPGVVTYQSNLILPTHIERHPLLKWPVALPPRVVCDLAVRLSEDTLKKVLDGARRDKKLSHDEVWECPDDLRARGRRRTTVLDRLLASRLPGFEKDESDGELVLLRWLLDAGLPPPEQQHWVVVNGMRYRCDLAYVQQRIDLEWDAFSTHGQDRTAFDYDKLRDDDFDAAGWQVVRVTDAWTPARAVAAVNRALRRAA